MTILFLLLHAIPLYFLGRAVWFKWMGPEHVITYSDPELSDIPLKQRRNVYFILLDIYTSIEGLDLFGLDQTPFLKGLSRWGFSLYRSFFSNFQTTQYAMPSYLNMSIKNEGKLFYDVPWFIRSRVIAGEGQVYRVFERNGYKASIILPNRYLLPNLPCRFELCSPPPGLRRFFKQLIQILLTGSILPSKEFLHRGTSSIYWSRLSGKESKDTSPTSIFICPTHVHQNLYGRCEQELETEAYKMRMVTTKQLVLEVVDAIIHYDPEAVLILASDHGPTLFNKCVIDVPLRTREEVIERQGVFLAIKWNREDDFILVCRVPDNSFHQLKGGSIKKSVQNGMPIFTEIQQ